MAALRTIELFDERGLVHDARQGSVAAFEELYRRHAPVAWRLALAVTRDPVDAAGSVAEAFSRVLTATDRASVQLDVPFRAHLLVATRHAAIDADARSHPKIPTRDATRLDLSGDGGLEVEAFDGLPERWRSVLWLTEVEGLTTEEAAHALRLSDDETAELAARARDGLHERCTQIQLRGATASACAWVTGRLPAYATYGLSKRETTRVQRHLDECAECQMRLAQVEDLTPRLPLAVASLPAMLLGTSEAAWRRALPASTGRLGLTLPGGREVPAWAERLVVGATAALIAIGITSAVVTGGRAKDHRPIADQAQSDGSFDLGDGESAAGADPDPSAPADDGGAVDPNPVEPGSAPAPTGAAPGSGPGGGEPPRVVTPIDAPTIPPSTPPTPSGPPIVPPPPAASLLDLTVRLDDSTGVGIGDQCIGVELLGIVIGCEPGDTGLTLLP